MPVGTANVRVARFGGNLVFTGKMNKRKNIR
jgi:hypothetical protein